MFFITNFLEGGSGEFSLGNSLLTAYFPTFIGFILMFIQLMGNVIINKYWAEGNLYLLFMQVYSFAQYYAMTQVLWNIKTYLYDMRIFRYLFFGSSISFMLIYWISLAMFVDLVIVKGKMQGRDKGVDMMMAMFIGYNLVEFIPTAFCSTFIILKELTMNQFAFSAEEEYTTGILLNRYNIDIF